MDTLLIHIPGHTVRNSLFFLFITKVLEIYSLCFGVKGVKMLMVILVTRNHFMYNLLSYWAKHVLTSKLHGLTLVFCFGALKGLIASVCTSPTDLRWAPGVWRIESARCLSSSLVNFLWIMQVLPSHPSLTALVEHAVCASDGQTYPYSERKSND